MRTLLLLLQCWVACSAAGGCSSHYSLFGDCCEEKNPATRPAESDDWSESPSDIAWDALKGVPK